MCCDVEKNDLPMGASAQPRSQGISGAGRRKALGTKLASTLNVYSTSMEIFIFRNKDVELV